MLTEEQIQELASKYTGSCEYPTRYVLNSNSFAKAIEAPLLARIAELETKLTQVGQGVSEETAQRAVCNPQDYCLARHIKLYTSPNQKDYEQELETIVKQYKEYIVGLETKAYTEISRLRAENATLSEKLDNLSK